MVNTREEKEFKLIRKSKFRPGIAKKGVKIPGNRRGKSCIKEGIVCKGGIYAAHRIQEHY